MPEGPPQAPLPRPSPESVPFWEACRNGELRLQRCRACGRFWFPPAVFCPECWSAEWTWERTSGRGKIHSFVVYRRAYHPAFPPPYVVAVVELAEGPHLLTRLIDVEPDNVRVGQQVEVVLAPVTEEVRLPLFRPER